MMKFKYLTHISVESSTFALFDFKKLHQNIKDELLDEKFNDPFYLEKNETNLDALRGNALIFANLDIQNNQKATEIRIISNESAFTEKMEKGFNTRKTKAIEQYFKKRKLNRFSLKKLKIKPLKITSGKIAFIQVCEAFHYSNSNKLPYVKPVSKEYKNGEGQYGDYWGFGFDIANKFGGFVNCENGIYDIYQCSVDETYVADKNETTILKYLKYEDLELNFPCCSNKIPIHDLQYVKRWGVNNVHCENCDKYYPRDSFTEEQISKIGGKKINKKSEMISFDHHPLFDFIKYESNEDELLDNEYGYIVKLRSEKLTNANMRFMF